jgi:hypothetical protein
MSARAVAFRPSRGNRYVPSSIQLLPAGSNIYIGLCNRPTDPHALCVDQTLFVFLEDQGSLAEMVRTIQDVVERLPADMPWLPDSDSPLRLDWIAQQLASREEDALMTVNTRPEGVSRKRLLPA